ncbi:hypothetical protein HYC85_024995 [Camellia sinensis]|uniref:Fe2OG dioxygenase domain-containing protein n=1 Tax=Camellia sinensis TaxID=4442 RepID=A0A7J7G9T0_CAMSI|nr:hypothetical protein HYC85_024995 [Camellia sinensis]
MAKASTYQSSTLISTAIFCVRECRFLFEAGKDVHTMPANYVFPPEERPGDLAAPLCKDIPVIDPRQVVAHDQADLLQQIMKASQDFGMFQKTRPLIILRTRGRLSGSTLAVLITLRVMLTTGKTVKQNCHPLEDHFQSWPEKPATARYREVVGTYSVEVRKLSLRILDLICEGLGIEAGYFADELSKIQGLVANHYPSCPNPSLVLGLGGHCDPNLLTILQQEVYGLQIFKDEQWVGIEPPAHAFVINTYTANQLEVINHGMSEELMNDTMSLFKEFFDMPVEDKAAYYSEDKSKSFRLYTSGLVQLSCITNRYSFVNFIFKEVVGTYSAEVRKLSLRILDLICEGMGIEMGYFADELSKIQSLQDVYGLQIFKGEQWVGVESLPHAFVIKIANQLEMISNGKLKSAKHRAVTNSSIGRTSIVTFISPSRECVTEPAKALVSVCSPLLFKAVQYKEFSDTHMAKTHDPNSTAVESYKLQA